MNTQTVDTVRDLKEAEENRKDYVETLKLIRALREIMLRPEGDE